MPDQIWTPERLIHYPLVEHVEIAPDARTLLYTVRSPYLRDDASEFRTQIYQADVESGATIQLTYGESASQPRYSPDGRVIAFLRQTPEGKAAGLWAMRTDGGEAWPLTASANPGFSNITKFRWSPDGSAIAFIALPWDEERETRRRSRDDVIHWRVDYNFAHLFLLDLSAGLEARAHFPIRQLTAGRMHVNGLGWHPDSKRIAFTYQDTPLLETYMSTRLAIVRAVDAADSLLVIDQIDQIGVNGADPFCSPDGRWIAVAQATGEKHWPNAAHVQLYSLQDGTSRALADVPDEQPILAGWSPDSRALYVFNQNGLGSEILALPVDGGSPKTIIAPTHHIVTAHINARGQAALVLQNFDEANTLYMADFAGATSSEIAPRRVCRPTAADFPEGPLPDVQLLRWQTNDGFEIEGMLYLPAGAAPGNGKLPLLLHIHGGPTGIFQRQFAAHPYYYTPAALCERGIAVLRCNPRGSGGYGRDFRFANMLDWGGGDYRDLQQGVDTVLEMGIADANRLGICGWSYGGYMTSWTITQTHRFRAASIGAPVTNPMTFCATSDIPSFIPDYFGGEAWEVFHRYQERSPIFHAHKVRTPAIIQHGDADERVPLEQGLQYYHVLQRNGVPVEMYIYPRQGHAITEPRLLADAARRNLDWFTHMLL